MLNIIEKFENDLKDSKIEFEKGQIQNFEGLYNFKDSNIAIFLCDPEQINEKTVNKKFLYNIKKEFTEKDINLIVIYVPELIAKYDIVLNRFKHKLMKSEKVVYARKCEIKEIDNPTCKQFVSQYHIQGHVPSSIKYGMFYNEDLIAVMTFSKPRYNTKVSLEMTRYCVKAGYNIVGNCSKFMARLMRDHNPESVLTYSDLKWSVGVVYEKSDFKHLYDSEIGFQWYKDGKTENRRGLWKGILPGKLEHFDPSISAHNNLRNHGYIKIFDLGQAVYSYPEAINYK